MLFVFDTNSFSVLSHYYPDTFPSVWDALEEHVKAGEVVSVREVRNELLADPREGWFANWVKSHPTLFPTPGHDEQLFVARIFELHHFRTLIGQKQRLKGTPVADPFVIASASAHGGTVVTEEAYKPNAARIPNVCEHFGLKWTNLRGFMHAAGWRF